MLLDYCSNIANEYKIKIGSVNKLVTNFGNKSNVLYYKNFQLCLSLGIKFTKVQRILKFKQLDCLKKYSDYNIDKKKC